MHVWRRLQKTFNCFLRRCSVIALVIVRYIAALPCSLYYRFSFFFPSSSFVIRFPSKYSCRRVESELNSSFHEHGRSRASRYVIEGLAIPEHETDWHLSIFNR